MRVARTYANLSQAELAEKSGVTQPTISQLENSGTDKGSAHTVRFARACGISPDWLDDEIGEMIPQYFITTDPKIVAACKLMEPMAEYAKDAVVKKLLRLRNSSSTPAVIARQARIYRIFFVLALSLLCVAQPFAAPADNPENARARADHLGTREFCLALGQALRKRRGGNNHYLGAMVDRALHREGVTSTMMIGIRQRRPILGMNYCAVLAALGPPEIVNRSVGRFGVHHQLVYRARDLYVYLDDYVVSAWQD